MTRYQPKKDGDAWRVYDRLLRRFAAGYGIKRYPTKSHCLGRCQDLNGKELGVKALGTVLLCCLLLSGCGWRGPVNPAWIFLEPDRDFRAVPNRVEYPDGVIADYTDFFSQC